jgi:hypothetical protein
VEARVRAEAAASAWSALGDRPRVAESLGYVGLATCQLRRQMHSSSSKRAVVFSSNVIEVRRRSVFSALIRRDLGLVARDQRGYVGAADHHTCDLVENSCTLRSALARHQPAGAATSSSTGLTCTSSNGGASRRARRLVCEPRPGR